MDRWHCRLLVGSCNVNPVSTSRLVNAGLVVTNSSLSAGSSPGRGRGRSMPRAPAPPSHPDLAFASCPPPTSVVSVLSEYLRYISHFDAFCCSASVFDCWPCQCVVLPPSLFPRIHLVSASMPVPDFH